MKILFSLLLFVFPTLLIAQSSANWLEELAKAMALQAEGNYQGEANKFGAWYKQQPLDVLNALERYEQSPNPKHRSLAYELLYATGRSSKDSAIRSQVVYRLATGCNDNDEATSTIICKNLQYFKKKDFSAGSRTQIINAMSSNLSLLPKLARLVGYLEIKEITEVLKDYTTDTDMSIRQKWEAWLALARLGNTDAIEYVLSQIKTVPVNDEMIYQFAPDLIYTRQHRAFDYLIQILNSDTKDYTSSNPDISGKMVCGYRIMEYLAPVVEGFPLKIHASGDIDAKDYNEALRKVRKWFKSKKGKYVIKKDSF